MVWQRTLPVESLCTWFYRSLWVVRVPSFLQVQSNKLGMFWVSSMFRCSHEVFVTNYVMESSWKVLKWIVNFSGEFLKNEAWNCPKDSWTTILSFFQAKLVENCQRPGFFELLVYWKVSALIHGVNKLPAVEKLLPSSFKLTNFPKLVTSSVKCSKDWSKRSAFELKRDLSLIS